MQSYANLSGRSGVVAYQLSDDQIIVEFKKGKRYLYTNAHTGFQHVAEMKKLAKEGRGLAAYIARNVKSNYAAKV